MMAMTDEELEAEVTRRTLPLVSKLLEVIRQHGLHLGSPLFPLLALTHAWGRTAQLVLSVLPHERTRVVHLINTLHLWIASEEDLTRH